MIDRQLPGQEADDGKQAETELRPTAVPDKSLPRAIGNQAMQRWAAPRLAAPGALVQRQAAEAGDTAVPPAPVPQRPPLIVPDEAAELQPGQMRKSEFLAQLRTAVCQTADEALQDTIYATIGCPYIERWFAYYSGQGSAHIERALQRFVPATNQATTAQSCIPLICQRVRQGVEEWLTTGDVTGIPEGAAEMVPPEAGGPPGETAVGSLISGAGAALSRVGALLFKRRENGPETPADPTATREQLGPGQPLNGDLRRQMAGVFGTDFAQVRIHTDADAGQLADEQNARAFTIGEHIAFAPGEYQPGDPIGSALLAHELAHVMQQEGAGSAPLQTKGPDYGALEEDADQAAVTAVVSLWSGVKGKTGSIARNALPNLRSGLRLQRCSKKSSGPIGPTRLAQARTNFRSYNSQLTEPQKDKIVQAIEAVAADNLNLQIAFYDYYSGHDIEEASSSRLNSWRTGQLAETSPSSDTYLNPSVFASSYAATSLGPLLIHEFTHTRHESNPLGSRDYQEGDSYAIEYFYAGRSGDAKRQGEILTLMANPAKLTMPMGIPALQQHFRSSYATLEGLYEIIDTGSSTHAGSPFTTPTVLSKDEARAMVAELVSLEPGSHSARLTQIITWVNANLSSFHVPPI